MELGLSKLASQNGLEFMNMASFNEQMRQSLKTSIVLNLFSVLILLSVLVVILQLSKLTAKAENGHYVDLLKRIGVPKRYREKIGTDVGRRLLAGTFILEMVATCLWMYNLLHNGWDPNDSLEVGIYAGTVLIFTLVIAAYTFRTKDSKSPNSTLL